MPKLNVSRSIEIDAPAQKVHDVVSNFNQWRPWSPWLITEPEATIDVREDNKFYTWEGKRVGSGQMEVINETPTKVEYDLLFLKPWKSQAKTHFTLAESNGKTKVTWVMDSSLPFFMFWMKKTTEGMIGMDYSRGLSMLKEYVEDGKINSKLEFVGENNFVGFNFVGIKNSATINGMPKTMEADFGKLFEFFGDKMDKTNGKWFSQYHKFQFGKDSVVYTAGMGVKEPIANLPEGFFNGKLEPSKMHTVKHIGPYKHIGNAWSAGMMMARSKEFKQNKGYHPVEFYVNNPQEVKPEEIETDISFAVK